MVSFDYLNATKAKTQAKINPQNHKNGFRVTVGMATCGITAGAGKVFQTLKQLIASNNLNNIDLAPVGCVGECALEPLVEVIDHQGQKTTYCKVSPQDIEKIVNQHL